MFTYYRPQVFDYAQNNKTLMSTKFCKKILGVIICIIPIWWNVS